MSAKVRDLRHLQIALYMRFYYNKQPLLHSILLYYYYSLILSYISVIRLFVSFVFELGYNFPESHDMFTISFNSYLNFCIQKMYVSHKISTIFNIFRENSLPLSRLFSCLIQRWIEQDYRTIIIILKWV